MVEVPNKKTATSSSIPLRKSPKKTSFPTRELKKRKGVSFEDNPVSSHPSTADYLYSQKKEWSYINTVYSFEDENSDQRDGDDAELLGLCDWFESEAGSLLNASYRRFRGEPSAGNLRGAGDEDTVSSASKETKHVGEQPPSEQSSAHRKPAKNIGGLSLRTNRGREKLDGPIKRQGGKGGHGERLQRSSSLLQLAETK